MPYVVVLKSLKAEGEVIVLESCPNMDNAQEYRKLWRKALGSKWTVNRRPGLDTLDHLALTVEKRGD